jgi:hypothetical protein
MSALVTCNDPPHDTGSGATLGFPGAPVTSGACCETPPG